MNKSEFIKQLAEETGLSLEQCRIVNEVLEDDGFIGQRTKERIIADLVTQLKIEEARAMKIYEAASKIIGSEIKHKLTFGGFVEVEQLQLDANATNSICPKGWKMATSGRDTDGKPLLDDGSFAGMLSRYGFRFEEKNNDSDGYLTNNAQDNAFKLHSQPFFLANTGDIELSMGILWATGNEGLFRSSTVITVGASPILEFNMSTILPGRMLSHWYGFSLRCLAFIIILGLL